MNMTRREFNLFLKECVELALGNIPEIKYSDIFPDGRNPKVILGNGDREFFKRYVQTTMYQYRASPTSINDSYLDTLALLSMPKFKRETVNEIAKMYKPELVMATTMGNPDVNRCIDMLSNIRDFRTMIPAFVFEREGH